MALADYAAPLPESLTRDIQRAFDQALELARENLDYRDPPPELLLSLKSARMAGRASPHKNVIELNKVIFRNNAEWEFIYDTLAHEIAHIVASRQFKSRGHDARWKAVAQALGANPRASGHFDISNAEVRKKVKRKTFPFICECQNFDFGAQRLNSFLKGSRYQCRNCKTEIRPDPKQREAFTGYGTVLQRTRLALLRWH